MACWPARGCAKPVSRICASSRKAATSAAPGTGTVIRARPAISKSYIYLPLLEEVGYIPVEKYTRAPEILEHSRAIARKFDLYRDVCFQTEVTEMRWDEEISRWIIRTNRSDAMKARFVVMANGPLHRPKLPGIPGVETFKGHSFHTSRWDYHYTGGDCWAG